ncbi:MAG: hypothetical protein KF729_12410 [Sandaracinaceae bacterium]|nr:hypothetical protein [Sandaracinaceae bacterium]
MRQFDTFIEIHGNLRPADVCAHHWSPERYEAVVHRLLNRIARTRVGQAVLDTIIAPLIITPHTTYYERAYAESVSLYWPHALAANDPSSDLDPNTREMTTPTGQGQIGGLIGFTPAHFATPDTPDEDLDLPAGVGVYRSDEVLVHECLHAIEGMWGRIRRAEIARHTDDIARIAEYRAVYVTNMYRSELGRALRGPYTHSTPLLSSGRRVATYGYREAVRGRGLWGFRRARMVRRRADPEHQHIFNFDYWTIHDFIEDIPVLAQRLASIPRSRVPYNPFLDHDTMSYDEVLVPEPWLPHDRTIDPEDVEPGGRPNEA